jgi:zinc protease
MNRWILRAALACSLAAIAVPAVAAPRAFAFSNGLVALLDPDSLAASAAVDVWYDGGSRSDPPGAPGMAYVLSRTALALPPESRRELEAQGATFGVGVNADYVVLSARMPGELVDRALQLQLDHLSKHALTENGWRLGVAMVRDDRANRERSAPIVPLYERVDAAMFAGQPYGNPTTGAPEKLASASFTDVQRQLERQFGPGKALLVVTGRFDDDPVASALSSRFGAPVRPTAAAAPAASAKAQPAGGRLSAGSPIRAPIIIVAYRGLPDRDPDSAALEVLARYLAEGSASWLARTLIGQSGVIQLQGSFERRRDASRMLVAAAIQSASDSAKAEAGLLQAIGGWAKKPLPAEDLMRAKRRVEASLISEAETAGGRSEALATAQILSGDWRGWQKRIDRVRAVTGADVQRVAAKVFVPSRRTLLWTRPGEDEDQP